PARAAARRSRPPRARARRPRRRRAGRRDRAAPGGWRRASSPRRTRPGVGRASGRGSGFLAPWREPTSPGLLSAPGLGPGWCQSVSGGRSRIPRGRSRLFRVRAAIGLFSHTGWSAALAVVGGPARVIERSRLDLVEQRFEVGAVYHVAKELPISQAEARVLEIRGRAERTAA